MSSNEEENSLLSRIFELVDDDEFDYRDWQEKSSLHGFQVFSFVLLMMKVRQEINHLCQEKCRFERKCRSTAGVSKTFSVSK